MKDNNFQSFSHLKTDQMQKLIECMTICRACAKFCIDEGHKKTALSCHECADACGLAINFTCCHSAFVNQAIDLCAEVCKKCADECQKMQVKHCQECAQACKRCQDACSGAKTR